MSDEETIRIALIEAAPASEALSRLIAAKEQAEKERDEAIFTLHATEESCTVLTSANATLTARLRSMCEAMELFVSARLVNEKGEHAGWRISGKGSVNEAYERARAELDAAKKELDNQDIPDDPNSRWAVFARSFWSTANVRAPYYVQHAADRVTGWWRFARAGDQDFVLLITVTRSEWDLAGAGCVTDKIAAAKEELTRWKTEQRAAKVQFEAWGFGHLPHP